MTTFYIIQACLTVEQCETLRVKPERPLQFHTCSTVYQCESMLTHFYKY